jgi:hypothetical protein
MVEWSGKEIAYDSGCIISFKNARKPEHAQYHVEIDLLDANIVKL